MPAKFVVHFDPHMTNFPKGTKLHLNLTLNLKKKIKIETASWKIRYYSAFCNTRVNIPVTAIPQGCSGKHWPLK